MKHWTAVLIWTGISGGKNENAEPIVRLPVISGNDQNPENLSTIRVMIEPQTIHTNPEMG